MRNESVLSTFTICFPELLSALTRPTGRNPDDTFISLKRA